MPARPCRHHRQMWCQQAGCDLDRGSKISRLNRRVARHYLGDDMRLEGRNVLLTGATGGIGGVIAHELAARGCALTVTGRREADLARLVTELGPPARGFTADLTNLAEVRELLDRADPVDILVACAGIEIPQDLADLSDETLEEAMRINLLAP